MLQVRVRSIVLTFVLGTGALLFCLDKKGDRGFCEKVSFQVNNWQIGDLVLVKGKDWKSTVVRMIDGGSVDFTHIGILLKESNDLNVVHASAEKGMVVCESLESFLDPAEINEWAVARLIRPFDSVKLVTEISRTVQMGITFDHDFSWETDSSLYCTELVVKILRRVNRALLPDRFVTGDYVFPSDFAAPSISMLIVPSAPPDCNRSFSIPSTESQGLDCTQEPA